MPAEDQKDFLEAVGLTEPGLNRVIRAGYELLSLVTYFTVGPKEARAWTITKGTKAPGRWRHPLRLREGLHPAETIAFADYTALGGEAVRAMPASCGSRARSMSSPTGTSSTSASPTEAWRPAWLPAERQTDEPSVCA